MLLLLTVLMFSDIIKSMSRVWNVSVTVLVIIVAIIVGVVIVNNKKTEPVEDKVDVSEVELVPDVKPEKEYTGYCAIHGKYRQRYVECVGDYDPEAKNLAEAKAIECNESEKAVKGCTDRYQ